MKTKQIPAIVMLLAGAITSIVSILSGRSLEQALWLLLGILLLFYAIGGIVKLILDKNIGEMKKEEEAPLAEEETPEEENKEVENLEEKVTKTTNDQDE